MARTISSDKWINWEAVREVAFALPNVEDGLSYGAPALKHNGQLMIRLREDLNAIVVLTTFEEREDMMAAEPATYYITDHYLNYPYVLVSLENVREDALSELVGAAHRLTKGKKGHRWRSA